MFNNNRHAEAIAGQQTALTAAWRCGNGLLAAKAKVKAQFGHGHWMAWVKANFNGSHDTANAYMKLAKSERAQNLDPNTSIRQALHAVCGPDPRTPATSNPFLKPFYEHMTQMANDGMSIRKAMNSEKWPDHQAEVFVEHRAYIDWNVKILADVLNLLLGESPTDLTEDATEGEKAARAETLERLEALQDAISKFLDGATPNAGDDDG
jgi:hypothetical protein